MTIIKHTTVKFDERGTVAWEKVKTDFEAEYKHTLVSDHYEWEAIWRELVNTGIYRRGADTAEVGTSWLESLANMQALRPFTEDDIRSLGGSNSFIQALWHQVSLGTDHKIWGIPFRADVRMLFYWKDMVEAADVDPDVDFQSPDKFAQSMSKLTRVVPTPFATITSRRDHNIVYDMASWLWANGGDFISKDGRELLLNTPKSREGFFSFYNLFPFIDKDNLSINRNEISILFSQRKIAALIAGPWFKSALVSDGALPEDLGNIGITILPGPSYVGGTVLVLWQHSKVQREAMDFLRYLLRPEVQASFCKSTGLLPVRHENWSRPPYLTEDQYRIMYQALLNGRAFYSAPLWGMIEEKLMSTLHRAWSDVLSQKSPDVPQIVGGYLDNLEVTLNLAIAG